MWRCWRQAPAWPRTVRASQALGNSTRRTAARGDDKVQSGTLVINQTDDGVTIAEDQVLADGKDRKLGVECNTMGKDCKLKEGTFSLYYNGAALVMVQTHGNDMAVKRRLTVSPDGGKLTMDVIHLAPAGKPDEMFEYVKQ